MHQCLLYLYPTLTISQNLRIVHSMQECMLYPTLTRLQNPSISMQMTPMIWKTKKYCYSAPPAPDQDQCQQRAGQELRQYFLEFILNSMQEFILYPTLTISQNLKDSTIAYSFHGILSKL